METPGPKPIPIGARFWLKVDRSGGPDACWLFTGHHQANGYGQFSIGSRRDDTRRLVIAHRVAWELANGPIPEGMCVLHRCDNPPCCNPRHLRLGTHADNMADKMEKGRVGIRRGRCSAAIA